MGEDDFGRRVLGVSSLADPVRRRLYEFVVDHEEPVSREQAATGVGVAHHKAKFHLDRLVADGLLVTSTKRLSGRTGPGAGRPAKLYRRATEEVAVSVPERHYDLAGHLMAQAIDRSTEEDVPVADALDAVAAAHGRALARRARADAEPGAPGRAQRGLAAAVLSEEGYHPRVVGDELVLLNCPFHALAAAHTALVCRMNLALLGGVAEGLGDDAAAARLEPRPGRCCVVLDLS